MKMFVVGEYEVDGSCSWCIRFAESQADIPFYREMKHGSLIKELDDDTDKSYEERGKPEFNALRLLIDIQYDDIADVGCGAIGSALEFAFEMGRQHERRVVDAMVADAHNVSKRK